ncbi:MAG: hypothetical protein ACK42F_12430 [Sphingobacteriales bacterium]
MGRKAKKEQRKKVNKKQNSGLTYVGTLDITRSGMGFVIVENLHQDILIRPSELNRAFHGDLVKVKLIKERPNRSEGSVVEVLERKQTEFIGLLEANQDYGFFIPDSSRRIPDFYIPSSSFNNAKDGDRVVVKMLSWNEKDKNPVVR